MTLLISFRRERDGEYVDDGRRGREKRESLYSLSPYSHGLALREGPPALHKFDQSARKLARFIARFDGRTWQLAIGSGWRV